MFRSLSFTLAATVIAAWAAVSIFCARAIADLYARFPRLRVVFRANRKIAETCTRNYFAGVSGTAEGTSAQDGSAIQKDDEPIDASY